MLPDVICNFPLILDFLWDSVKVKYFFVKLLMGFMKKLRNVQKRKFFFCFGTVKIIVLIHWFFCEETQVKLLDNVYNKLYAASKLFSFLYMNAIKFTSN